MAAVGMAPKDDPSTPSQDYKAMEPIWCAIADILQGAEAIKAKGTIYLPKFQKESQGAYDLRKASAPWRPEFTDALGALASKPFSKPVTLNPEAPEVMLGKVANTENKQRRGGLVDDIDGQGNSLHVFARETFYYGVGFGLEAIYVTYPEVGPARNLAEEKLIGARPYWVHVRSGDIIDCKRRVVAGRTVVSDIRMREWSVEPDGFEEVTVQRIRRVYLDELDRPVWTLWRAQDNTWVEEKSGTLTGVKDIPVVLFFTGPVSGNYRVKPPLADLAHMQIELYRRMSRHDQIETLAGSPMLVGKGFRPPEPTQTTDADGRITDEPAPQIEVGPGVVLFAPPAADGVQPGWDYIQPAAANMTALQASVDKCMEDFRRLALQPTTRQSGNATATENVLVGSKSLSAVHAWANGLADALNQALVFTCQWLKIADTVTAVVHTDFGAGRAGMEEARVIGDAQKRGVISKQTEREELVRRDILSSSFDEEREEQRIAEEQEGLEPEEGIDPRTGLPIEEPIA